MTTAPPVLIAPGAPRLLVACEESGVVREAFRRRGIDAVSCDLAPTEQPGPHIQGDVLAHLDDGWDGLIAHPPCTYLSVSGMHWNVTTKNGRPPVPGRVDATEQAVEFFRACLDARIPRRAIENPVGIISTRIRQPSQIIQPFEFGHDASKKTCLWLVGYPPLVGTLFVAPMFGCRTCRRRFDFALGKYGCPNGCETAARPVWGNQTTGGQNKLGPSDDRAKIRSRTYEGIAEAMAVQWAPVLFRGRP